MSIIFGYDKIINKRPITNGYEFKNNEVPVCLGFAGYEPDPVIKDDDLNNLNLSKKKEYHATHEIYVDYLNIQIEEIEKIEQNYFYVINVFPHDFFIEMEKSKKLKLSEKVVKDIQNKKAKLLVIFSNEAVEQKENVYELFSYWAKKYSIPINSILLISGNYKIDSFKDINYIAWSMWEDTMSLEPYDIAIKEFIYNIKNKKARKKIFLNYNRRPHFYRLKLVYKLKQENLFNFGLISLGNMYIPNQYQYLANATSEEFINSLPITFDDTDLEINQVQNFVKEDYLNTYISLVSETTISPNSIFPSEKVWKPIRSLHPFIVISSPGFIKQLHKFGYLTFSKWIDESYDNEENLDKKLDLIIKEIKKLTVMSHEKLQDMLVEMLPTLQHNLNNFKKRTSSKELQIQLEKELWK